MNNIFIKLTAVGYQTSTSTQYFAEPKLVLINPFKIISAIPNEKGSTELRDEIGKNVILVKESPTEIYELINQALSFLLAFFV